MGVSLRCHACAYDYIFATSDIAPVRSSVQRQEKALLARLAEKDPTFQDIDQSITQSVLTYHA